MTSFVDSNYLAYVNIFLGLVGFVWLLLRTTHRWGEYPREIKLLLVATLGFVLALLETSVEALSLNEPGSYNMFVIFFVKAFLIFVLVRTRFALYRTGTRHAGNGDSAHPNARIYSTKTDDDNQ